MSLIKTAVAGLALTYATSLSVQAQEIHFIMCGDEREQDKQIAADFAAKHDGVTVNLESVPWANCQDKSMTLAAAGNPPSIAYMGSRTLKQLASNDLILPIEMSEERKALYQPGVLATVNIEGTVWGMPHAFSTKALYMNCDVIESAGATCEAPATWDDLYALASSVAENSDAAGIGLAAKDFDNTMHQFLNYLYSNGGQVLDPATGEVTLDSPQTVEALEFYGKLVDVAQDGPTAWERDGMKDLFNDGKIAMYINGPWGRGQHNEDINQKIVSIPAGPQGVSGSILITDSIAVFKGSGHEELAMELAEAITTGEEQYKLDESWGLTPIIQYEKAGIENPFYVGDAFWENFTKPISTGGPEPVVTDFKAIQGVFTAMIQGIVLKEDTAENLVAIAAEELEEIK